MPNSLPSSVDLSQKRILLTGGSGFLGKHVLQQLQVLGVKPEQVRIPRSRTQDLRRWEVCQEVVQGQDIVIHLAAHVGGIGLNQAKPAELFYDNLIMGSQLIHAAYLAGVEKFVCVGTICAYPKFTPVPFKEEDLWNGYPEETNAPYGIAKKALLVQLQALRPHGQLRPRKLPRHPSLDPQSARSAATGPKLRRSVGGWQPHPRVFLR
jgi:GDP-L-fucose synthase